MTKLEEFIERAKKVHCSEDLDYSKAIYINNRTPLCIIDHDLMADGKTEYGEYWQTPYNHLKGHSHPLKRCYKIAKSKREKQEEIIKRFKEVHKNENLDYSKVEYKKGIIYLLATTGISFPIIILNMKTRFALS